MILVGFIVLIVLASFIVSVIVTILELLAVIVGIILVLGGIALVIFGRKGWRLRPWDWGENPART